jgi:hypothetical protein
VIRFRLFPGEFLPLAHRGFSEVFFGRVNAAIPQTEQRYARRRGVCDGGNILKLPAASCRGSSIRKEIIIFLIAR